ncbi:unnamed protein product [Orchesella dallaii]|uniref:C2H2-type domain-containing protein n=1 Tax=Orchesella dallaii TaxID=48710 RepID=A0ABP1RVG7_9HEXA
MAKCTLIFTLILVSTWKEFAFAHDSQRTIICGPTTGTTPCGPIPEKVCFVPGYSKLVCCGVAIGESDASICLCCKSDCESECLPVPKPPNGSPPVRPIKSAWAVGTNVEVGVLLHTNLNICPHCPSRFDRANRLKTHVENVHKNVLIAEPEETEAQERKVRPSLKKFQCEVENCGGSFTGRVALAKHFKSMHTNEKEEKENHPCRICGKVVIDLKLHMTLKHTPEEEKNFEYDPFPKKFFMEKLLKDHKKKAHALGKPWKCKVCGKDFKFEKYLKEHEIGHEEVKPFECHLCGMGFTRRHVLNRHLGNVHEGKNREDQIKKGGKWGMRRRLVD